MASYMCPLCVRRYPQVKEFQRCEACDRTCEFNIRKPNHTAEEARSVFKTARFDRYYENKHKPHRDKMGYPEPEEIGRMQAKREAKVLRDLEAMWEES